MNEQVKILWLASWYPNSFDAYNGDFIERHAEAVSEQIPIYLIHQQLVPANFQEDGVSSNVLVHKNLTTHIQLIRASSFPGIVGKILNNWRYNYSYKRAISRYMKMVGKPQLVHVQVPMKAGLMALWLKEKYKIPYLVTEHYGIYNKLAPDNFTKRNLWYKVVTKKIFEQAFMLLPVSDSLGKAINKYVLQKPYEVVYNVVNTNIFYPKFVKKVNEIKCQFIHVSTMNHPKNAEGIIDAFALAYQFQQNIALQMVGDAPATLKEKVNTLGLQKAITFTGVVTQDILATYFHTADFFVLFSRYENMPCSVLEALCCGVPVIASNIGGLPEVIHQQNGFLIEEGNVEELTQTMLTAAASLHIYDRYAIAVAAKEKFSYARIANQIISLYKLALEKG